MKYQICKRTDKSALPVDWYLLPKAEEVLGEIDPSLLYNVLKATETGDIEVGTVMYFRPVKKFRKDILVFEDHEGNEFGV
ncbi:MAG: hypothetical protein J6I84_03580 [Bacilli bacterium]|nr:hypothetical protein [Bacilli bacterium]